jgi:tetratricopeptide (TPR) repeat protein
MSEPHTRASHWTWLAVIAALVLTAFVYWPGLRGGFVHDDFGFIVQNGDVQVTRLQLGDWVRAAESFPSAHVGRWLTMLSFAANHYFSGLDPFWMKLTNLCLHLGNGVLLFLVLRALFDLWSACHDRRHVSDEYGNGAALAITGVWLLLPIHLTAVLYVSQRLESLSNLFVLLGLWLYLRARLRLQLDGAGLGTMAAALVVCTGLGLLAKESAVLLPLYAACVEFSVAGLRRRDGQWQRGVIGLYLALLVLPLLAGLYWLATWMGGETTFERPYTTVERLLTETRVLVHYIDWIFLPTREAISLFHDDFSVSNGLFDPPSTLACLVALIVLACLALWQRSRRPLFCLGILWFFAGHLMTATVLPLELVYEHRNYFPAVGLLLALASLLLLEPLPKLQPRMAVAVTGAMLLFYAFTTNMRAREWSSPLTQAIAEVSKRPASISAHYELGRRLIEAAHNDPASQRIEQARSVYRKCTELPGTNMLCEQGLLLLPENPADEARIWKALIAKLQVAPPSQNNISGLANLWRCQQQQACPERSTELAQAFRAALTHSHPNARLLAIHADFAAGALHDTDLAAQQLRRAVALEPSKPVYRFNLIQLLLAKGEIDAARDEIAALRRRNLMGSLDELLADLERQLSAAEQIRPQALQAAPIRRGVTSKPPSAVSTIPYLQRCSRTTAMLQSALHDGGRQCAPA